MSNTTIWKNLKKSGVGSNLTVDKFSTKHGDLIIEATANREFKVRGGAMQGAYSADLDRWTYLWKTAIY